jgi:VanZ family protein
VDAAAEQHCERTRVLFARLDAIIEQHRKPDAPELSEIAKAPVEMAPTAACATNCKLLRGVWMVVMLAVSVGSLLPSDSAPIQVLNSLGFNDKLLHFLAYALIAVVPILHETWLFTSLASIGTVALGGALELGQTYCPGRSCDLADFAADGLGVSFGLLVGWYLRAWLYNRIHRSVPCSIEEVSWAVSESPSLSPVPGWRFELELLLIELKATSEALATALDAETEAGNRALATRDNVTDSAGALALWSERRAEVHLRQAAYCRAADSFREFLQHLPPPAQDRVRSQGILAMAVRPA